MLASSVQLIEDSLFQVQSIGNQDVNNLVSLLNIVPEESNSYETSYMDFLMTEKSHMLKINT